MNRTATVGAIKRIGEQLISAGLITKEQLGEALIEQKRTGAKVVATLVALGHIDQLTFLNFLAKQPGIASIDLAGYCIPQELIALIPVEFARKHEVVPMDRMGSDLTVGMACPLDVRVIDELAAMTGLRVRALLVATEAVRLVLDRYYPVADPEARITPDVSGLSTAHSLAEVVLDQVTTSLTFESVMALVRSISGLPALPDTVRRVQETVEDPAMGARDVAEVLKGDPALAAKVISLANAPAHGFKHRVDSVENATALLGLREVYSVSIAAAVVDSFGASSHFDYTAFWRRSVTCGNLAKILARTSGFKERDGVFAAGLLHDIGRAVFAEVAAIPYATINHKATDDAVIADEHESFGIAHPEVGYVVARNWGLPDALCEAIRFHHCPERANTSREFVSLVALASQLGEHLEMPDTVSIEMCTARCEPILQALNIDSDQLSGILDVARALRNATPD